MSIESLKQSSYDLAMLQHINKSNEELDQIVKKNYALFRACNPTTNEGIIKATQLTGETVACNTIINGRRDLELFALNKVREIKIELNKLIDEKVKDITKNVNYHSILIAKILEEEGPKSFNEIKQWNNELNDLEETELRNILNYLCKERMITFNNNKYKYSLLFELPIKNNITKIKNRYYEVLNHSLKTKNDNDKSYLEKINIRIKSLLDSLFNDNNPVRLKDLKEWYENKGYDKYDCKRDIEQLERDNILIKHDKYQGLWDAKVSDEFRKLQSKDYERFENNLIFYTLNICDLKKAGDK